MLNKLIGLRFVAAAAVLGALLGQPTLGQGGKSEAAARLLKDAVDKIDIKAPGSPPIRLIAKVQIRGEYKETIEGSYELLWKSPEVWRETIKFPDSWQVRMENGEKLWVWRKPKYVATNIYRVLDLLDSLRRVQAFPGQKAEKVVERVEDGKAVRWIEVKYHGKTWKRVFLDASTAMPTRLDYGAKGEGGGYQFEAFLRLGERSFPSIIKTLDEGRVPDTLQVQELRETDFDDPKVFEAPGDAQWMPWCPNPERPSMKEGQTSNPIVPWITLPPGAVPIPPGTPESAFGKHVTVYGVIGKDGQWHGLTIVNSGGKDADDLFLAILRQERYRPATCNGKPIEFEMVREINRR